MLFPLTGSDTVRNFPSRFFRCRQHLDHLLVRISNMERKDRSEEWEDDPVSRSYGDEDEEETYDDDEDLEDEEDEDDLDDDDDEDDDYEEEEEEEVEDDY